jgi:hypothetical protein
VQRAGGFLYTARAPFKKRSGPNALHWLGWDGHPSVRRSATCAALIPMLLRGEPSP